MNYIQALRELIDEERVTRNETVLEHHSHDESYHAPHLPDVVVFPQNTDEVSKLK